MSNKTDLMDAVSNIVGELNNYERAIGAVLVYLNGMGPAETEWGRGYNAALRNITKALIGWVDETTNECLTMALDKLNKGNQ